MNLSNILSNTGTKHSIRDYIHLENFVNDGSPSGFTSINRLDSRFSPGNIKGFNVPIDTIETSICEVFKFNPSLEIKGFVEDRQDVVNFLIHPEEFEKGDYTKTGEIYGYPTASGRTLLITGGNNAFFAKLHYSGVLGRIGREMTKKRVKGAGLISYELDNLVEKGILDSSFSFLPESYGIVTNKYGDKEVGMSYREFKPKVNRDEKTIMIPFFSLFSSDVVNPNDLSILVQLCSLKHNPRDFFINEIVSLILKSFSSLLLDGGLLPENHAQNILLEITGNGTPISIIHRDLYEFYVDRQFRNKLGLHTNGFEKLLDIDEDSKIYFQMKSYMFDFKLGEYVLYPLVREFCRHFGYSEKQIIDEIIDLFESLSGEWREIFYPYDKYYYFDKILNTYVNGKPNFIEGNKPRFRRT